MTNGWSANSASPQAAEALAHGTRLAADGALRQAIAYVASANRGLGDPALEAALLQWRDQFYLAEAPFSPRPDWPPQYPDLFANVSGVPEIERRDLNADTLGAGIQHHGCVLVRGLFDPAVASEWVQNIDRTFADQALYPAAGNGWYQRNELSGAQMPNEARPWIESASGVMLADSPRCAFRYIDLLNQQGIIDVIADYLGERPMLSIGKTTLRKVLAQQRGTSWHQDGAFLGDGIRSVNLWVSLSHCGVTASGLDVMPRRMPGLVPTGTEGATFKWSVSQTLIAELEREVPSISPVFAPGDALLFDDIFMHRTSIPPGMIHDRYAIESWFFAPSSYPVEQGPLYV